MQAVQSPVKSDQFLTLSYVVAILGHRFLADFLRDKGLRPTEHFKGNNKSVVAEQCIEVFTLIHDMLNDVKHRASDPQAMNKIDQRSVLG
jgi:hypothetical protein